MPKFAETLNKYISKCLNAKHGRWENLWAGAEQTSYVEFATSDAVLEKTVYSITNMISSGRVPEVSDWKCVELFQPGDYKCKRPSVCFREEGKSFTRCAWPRSS